MKYVVLIYNDPAVFATMTEDEGKAQYEAFMAFNAEAEKRGVLRDAVQLQPVVTATTVRIREGKTLTTDGPFAETKEQLGGYYLLDCEHLDEAIELVSMLPTAHHSSVEIRPVMDMHH